MEPSDQANLTRAVRRLTIAVWSLIVLLALFAGICVVAFISVISFSRDGPEPTLTSSSPDSSRPVLEHFHSLPLEQQVEAASVIAISRYEKDGDRLKCVIAEILKQSPGTKFYYKVGDEFRQCSFYPKPNEYSIDGQIIFFIGSPAQFKYSTSLNNERVTGLGDMPIDVLRTLIKSQSK